jgi:sialidase-1
VNGSGFRYVHSTKDEGKSWNTRVDSALIDPGCNAGFLRYTSQTDGSDKNRILFSNPKSSAERKNLTIQISYDEGRSWTEGKTLCTGSSAYSSLTILKNGEIGVFFEKNDYRENVFVCFSLEWLTDGKDQLKDSP